VSVKFKAEISVPYVSIQVSNMILITELYTPITGRGKHSMITGKMVRWRLLVHYINLR